MANTKIQKKPKTEKQLKRRYRAIQWSCFGGEFITALMPYIVIGAVKFDEFFVKTGADSWKVSLGGILVMAVMGIAVLTLGAKKENKQVTNGMVAFICIWALVALIFFLLGSIIEYVSMIMFWGLIGLLGTLGLDITSAKYKKKADKYKEAIEDDQLRDARMDKEVQYQTELAQRIANEKRKRGLM